MTWSKLRLVVLPIVCWFLFVIGMTAIAPAAEIQMQVQAAPSTQSAVSPTGMLLTIEDAVRIGLDNHPRIKSANERIGSQQAVLGQQMSAYYPTLNLTNQYRTTQSSTNGGAPDASESYSSQANFNMTLYNFGKREGNVQAARDTLDATKQDYATTTQDIILSIKQAYYVYLGAQALVKVRQETVRSRDLLVRQAQGFYEVGTRARIDVVRAEANLYSAQADLIAAENGVKVAWVTLRNAMGSPRLPEQPVAEDSPEVQFSMNLAGARNVAFDARTELKSFDAQRKAADQLIATARRGHLPDLIFDASYGRRHVSNEPADNPTGGSRNTFPLQPTWSVQLSFNIPIFDGFRTTNRVEETLHNYYNVRAQEEDRRQQIALEVEQSYLRVVETQERIRATESAARAAKENLDLAQGRYQVGVGSIIEVTDAETLYTDAQTTYIRTIYDYKIADAQLARAMGDTRVGVLKPGSIK
ncbi:MAG TPA: TolC family protein [Candidatus Binatia bacterium]|jgi:TolC family type I secretion outer membrane protein|nr:TolC family protein [Candidatus Binatia bacterium]